MQKFYGKYLESQSSSLADGMETHKKKLESEDHIVYARRKNLFVNNWEELDRT